MTDVFDRELAAYYDRMIRWEKRLAFERPLFEALWKKYRTQSVLDAACGSGAHMELFAQQGLDVTGRDASSGMVEMANERMKNIGESRRPVAKVARWNRLSLRRKFDAVLCLGNSLPYVTDPGELAESLARLFRCVKAGGFLMIQYKNFAMLRARGERFLPLSTHRDASGAETIAVRQYDWHGGAVDFLAIILERPNAGAEWQMRHWTTRLATWPPKKIIAELKKKGARTRLCGSIGLDPFDPEKSDDVVIVAERAAK
ncbi:methyltransferase domain-containing protein [bacterium]|nr:methyltransferase domain-containing protein [bacterium]